MPKQRSSIDAPRHRAGGLSGELSFGVRARADTRRKKQLAPEVPRAAETNCNEDDDETGEALRLELRKPRKQEEAWTPKRPVTRGVVCPEKPSGQQGEGFHCPAHKTADVSRTSEDVGEHRAETGAYDELANPVRSNVTGMENGTAGVAFGRGDRANGSFCHQLHSP